MTRLFIEQPLASPGSANYLSFCKSVYYQSLQYVFFFICPFILYICLFLHLSLRKSVYYQSLLKSSYYLSLYTLHLSLPTSVYPYVHLPLRTHVSLRTSVYYLSLCTSVPLYIFFSFGEFVVTCCGGWTFSQNISSLFLMVCDLWYLEHWEEKADRLTDSLN